MRHEEKIKLILKYYWMYFFLGAILLMTISSMIAYQYMRQDPVTVRFKSAQGYITTQVVHKHPNETVGQVVEKAMPESSEYVCDYDRGQRINAIDTVNLYELISGNIMVDGTVIPFETTARTVQEVLDEKGVTISPVDIVEPDVTQALSNENSNINITRITSATEEKTEILPFTSETRPNDNLAYNEVKTIQAGQNGVRSYTEEVAYVEGREVERHITSDQRTEPVNEIIEIGTNLEIGKPDIQKGDIEGWRPYVIRALEMNGIEPTESRINRVLRQINTESAGDQNAHQEMYDTNSLIGQEAEGLMQTIPYTFEHYHFPGYDDIYNGFHNLLAAINYAKEAYGEDLIGLGEGHGY